MRPLRIAMLTHSTNPRGGVVHAMHLSEALTALGHEVVLHAPDAKGNGFFRKAQCEVRAFPVSAPSLGMTELVKQRIADYVSFFQSSDTRRFDLFHAHDGISGNGLATLKDLGTIDAFARTVHHIDQFADPHLNELQERSIQEADAFFTVSEMWKRDIRKTRGINATVVGNGVNAARFSNVPPLDLEKRYGISGGPVFLSVGGVEQRKNTIRVIESFRQVLMAWPTAQLIIAGGASILDHTGYQDEFEAALSKLREHKAAVHIIGPLPDDEMPGLYAAADTLVFPSIKEGFGLVILEAMASGIPAVVSSIEPFTEFLGADDVLWCDPFHAGSIAEAMCVSLTPAVRKAVVARGYAVAARHTWERTAKAHLPTYSALMEHAHA